MSGMQITHGNEEAVSRNEDTGCGLEPFRTAQEIIATGLFPELTEDKLRYYVRQGVILAYGPSKNKTYLVSEVYESWKQIGRGNGHTAISAGPQAVGGGLSTRAWKKV